MKHESMRNAMQNRMPSGWSKALLAAAAWGVLGVSGVGVGVANAQPGENDLIAIFLDPVAFPAGSYPYGIAAADLLGEDGLPELVVANGGMNVRNCGNDVEGQGTVTIYQNTGNWSPDPAQGLMVAQTISLCDDCVPAEVAIADVDADGNQDIIVSTAGPGGVYGVYVVRNDGQGGFPQQNIDFYPTPLPVRGLATVDFNNDGFADIAAGVDFCVGGGNGAGPSDTVYILKNWGDFGPGDFGTLQQEEIHLGLGLNKGPCDIVTGEYTNGLSTLPPTRIDIISANMWDDSFSELENLGNWNFKVNQHDSTCSGHTDWQYEIITGNHFGTDQHLDFACTTYLGDYVDVFLGDSMGGYTTRCDDSTLQYKLHIDSPNAYCWGVDSGHLNGGTNIDLAVTLMAEDEVSVLYGKPNGRFRQPDSDNGYLYSIDPPADPGSTTNPIMVLIVDLNLDGFGDLVTTNHHSDNISVLINDLFVVPGL